MSELLCDCLHTKEEHYNGEGECQSCACTWYHPSIASIICQKLNEAFGSPFLPEAFVEATDVSGIYNNPTIALRIGARAVTFTLKGEWIGQGTEITSEWFAKSDGQNTKGEDNGKKEKQSRGCRVE